MNKYFFLFLLFLFACKSSQKVTSIQLSNNKQVLFLNKLQAKQAIISDEKEFFFELITKTDVSLQLKEQLPEDLPRKEVIARYHQFLQAEVMNFSPADMAFIEKVFKAIDKEVQEFSKHILTPKIKLIKIEGLHYGPSVYYTRENCIVIPKDVLANPNYDTFHKTMLHELFHIYSRYNPEKRKALYELIGFRDIGNPRYLKMNKNLRERVLLNPDGVNYAVAIDLKLEDGKKVRAIPIIYSNKSGYVDGQDSFFSYLSFNLFPIQPPLSRLIHVKSDQNGRSKLNLGQLPDFHRQIRDNTGYIIHPDEIIADNFVILIKSLKDESYLQQYSAEGQELVQAIKEVMQD